MTISRFALVLGIFSATAWTQSQRALEAAATSRAATADSTRMGGEPRSARQDAAGAHLVTAGKVMAYGGLGIAVLGYYPGPRIAGLAAFTLGVPLAGIGASMVNRSASALDPGYKPDPRGWGWWITGTALVAAGLPGIATLDHGGSPGEVFGGMMLVVAGAGCDVVALAKFSRYAEEGRAVAASHSRVAVQPSLYFTPEGTGPGMLLTYRF